jgi:AGZA family xanthine/uracil permease-like MFS transporter
MGLYAKRPFAIATYMGENAFVAFTVVKSMGFTWQAALGATFVSGAIFAVLTMLHIRQWLINAIPHELKIAFGVGVGLFLMFIGCNETGLVRLGVPGAPVQVGHLTDPSVILAIVGFLLMAVMMIRGIRGAIFFGILLTTLIAVVTGHLTFPTVWFSLPPSIMPTMGQLDIMGSLRWEFFPILLTMLVLIFVDTMGSLIGVSYKAKLLDENGNLPEIEKPMLCDSIATMIGAYLGTTTSGAFIESAAGIQAGGKTGFTSVVTALLFLVALLFVPLFTVVPAYAYGPALILVGLLMISPIKELDFDNLTDIIPVLLTVGLMSFTYNLGIGMTAGFVCHPLLKLASGKAKDVSPGMWVLFVMSLLFFIFYPYA